MTDDTHKLLVTEGNAKGREIVIGSGEFLIGRLADDDNGRLADDPELSRRHARIMRTLDGAIEIEDLGSTNGTYVNDQRLETRRRLEPGDVVEVGQTRLTVLDAAGRSAQPTQFGRVRPAPSDTPRTPLVRPKPAAPRIPRPAIVAAAAVGGLAVVGVAVALASSGGDDPEPVKSPIEPKTLSVAQLIREGSPATVEISSRGPAFSRRGKTVRSSGGSGIVVDAKKGLVLTNAHVVSGQTSIKAKVGDGAEVSARVVSQAPCEDLALVSLRPAPKNLVEASMGVSANVKAGDRVTALGYPSAFEERVNERQLQASEGIVSAPSGKTSLGLASPALSDVMASGDTIRVEGYRFPPLSLFGARLNSLQSAVLRGAPHFKRTIKLR